MKQCSFCKIVKSFEEFSKNRTRKDGHAHKCKKCSVEYNRKYLEKNPSKKVEWGKSSDERRAYRQNHKNEIRVYRRAWKKSRRAIDPLFRLKENLRTRMWSVLKNRNTHFSQYIGCSELELISHLESQFSDGMSWNNYGKWHVDHKIPLASASSEVDIIRLFHYENLSPLWAIDNRRKGKLQW